MHLTPMLCTIKRMSPIVVSLEIGPAIEGLFRTLWRNTLVYEGLPIGFEVDGSDHGD